MSDLYDCEFSYDAQDYPANGRSDVDVAARKARALLAQSNKEG